MLGAISFVPVVVRAHAPATVRPQTPIDRPAETPILSPHDVRVKSALERAATYLRGKGSPSLVGELALTVNALAKIRALLPGTMPDEDPVLDEMVRALRVRCVDRFQPTRQGGPDNYEAGCAAMALAAVSRTQFAEEQKIIASYLLAKQQANGSWSYDNIPSGDTSMTQYSLLGLWESGSAGGGPIPPDAWDRAAKWLVTHQSPDGGFAYHPREPGSGALAPESTHTMTAGGLGSLLLCRDQLPGGRPRDPRGILLSVDERVVPAGFVAQVKAEQFQQAIDRATKWEVDHFTLDKARGEGDPGGGRWTYYYLYALERCATLAQSSEINGVDWYAEGAKRLFARQQKNGSWSGGHDDVVDTCFAVLFLVRSTKYTMEQIAEHKLSRGVLEPVNGARLKQLGLGAAGVAGSTPWLDPIPEVVKSRVPRWVAQIGSAAVTAWWNLDRGYRTQNSPQIMWALRALAQTHDLRVTPLLIDAMYYDDDADVQFAARDALMLISRRIAGRYTGSSDADWEAEISRWIAWYRHVRPQADFEDEVVLK
jgi:hypothetical protein